MYVVQALKLIIASIIRVVVIEKATSCRIAAGDLQFQRTSRLHNDASWPDLNVESVNTV